MAASMIRFLPQLGFRNFSIVSSQRSTLQSNLRISKVHNVWSAKFSSFGRCSQTVYRQSNKKPTLFLTQIRRVMLRGERNKFKPRNQHDGVPPEYKLIYSSGITREVYWGNLLIHGFVSAVNLYAAYCIAEYYLEKKRFDILKDPVRTYLLTMGVGMLLVLHMRGIASRTMLRIYYNETTDVFKAICVSRNPILERSLEYTPTEVQKKDISGYMAHYFGNLIIHGKAYMVEDKHFLSPHYYNHMMQWEKPVYREIDDNIEQFWKTKDEK